MNTNVIVTDIMARLAEHEQCFGGANGPLLKVSAKYPGLWLEHVYDAVFYAQLDKRRLYLAENAISAFIDAQTADGQLPFVVKDSDIPEKMRGYSQIQECVSFGKLVLAVYELNGDKSFLKKGYDAVLKWVNWLRANRMSRKTGLVEMFFGYDTGHDNSPRVLDLGIPRNYRQGDKLANAATLPPEDGIAPVLALDMSCNFYGNLKALEKMAEILGLDASGFCKAAAEVKKRIFAYCYDPDTCFFYDVDKQGRQRKILSCQVLHLFMEGVLDLCEDRALISELCDRYIFNEKHFYTPYPFPSVSVSDPAWKKHTPHNCWGYYTQSLTVLRCTLWMEEYGFKNEFDRICDHFASAWTRCYDTVKLGQELDPITGEPSACSEWYSSCMLMYLYCVKRKA